MTQVGFVQYAGIFLSAATLSLVLTPLALRLAVRHGIFDLPGAHKRHVSPVPYLGGLAIVTAFSVVVVGAALVRPPSSGLGELVTVFVLALLLAAVGLADDLRGLGTMPRLAVQVGAGAAVYGVGAGVSMFSAEPLNLVFTLAWVVGITNAFNLLDNMDGLSAGVTAVGAASFFVIAAVNGQFLVASLAAALAGCALGFLRHNFHPARIYMGDAGSLFLGFLVAYLGLKLRFDGPTSVTFLVPILVLGVAILDTTLVSVCRVLHGRSPFTGGRDHLSHRLVKVGLPVPAAVTVIYGAAASLGVVALVVSRVDRPAAFLLAGLVVVIGTAAGTALARVPVYDDAPATAEPADLHSDVVEVISAAEARTAVAGLPLNTQAVFDDAVHHARDGSDASADLPHR